MRGGTRFAAVFLAGVALAACKGGEGQDCKSTGPLGALYCDDGLICNEADGDTCEKPMSKGENQSCSRDALCAAGLWCDTQKSVCRHFLNPGDACSSPGSCGPDATCAKDPATRMTDCVPLTDGGSLDGDGDVDVASPR